MKPDVVGQLERDGKVLYAGEPVGNFEPDASNFTLTLGIDGNEVSLDLCGLRQAKLLIQEGERRLLLRQEQAMKRRNLSLDF
ncbi:MULTISPECIES: hypothetical protein [unclassified Variovorax]|uniref:hypothetical protein n=1 Tax=unclassified Variovorax TaxID=663243 RepID=UPI0008397F76|nr:MULTISPECIES: hypothetical protein [unclassified Variovorax]PNG49902.1 hypothetical protein CHC06_05483 [Variovorax sp. B2]PNG50774.1 hypothetical protein CHC07_05388 [Variovorax sp. B4]VTU42086.1 hypothetical protein H6P1_00106 [Variovorax sp. PBL-H6]VTU44262.1 hypothetical protein SRS16P1_00796 [Variovorax sp. SRS16]VTU44339.1 hypothetical protein E5P1_00789 [Variovorax sp. PBL-E5]